jgi:hypothetical protein
MMLLITRFGKMSMLKSRLAISAARSAPYASASRRYDASTIGRVASAALHVQVRLVHGDRVVAVGAVLGEQLPVRLDRVLVAARGDGHARRGLVGGEVQVVRRVREVLLKRLGLRPQVHEDEAAVRLHPRRSAQVVRGLVEPLGVRVVVRHRHQAAVGGEGPRVVEAAEPPVVAAPLAADLGAAVRARVEPDPYAAAAVAAEQDGAPGDGAGHEVVRVRDLRLVADVDPAALEDRGALPGEHVVVDERGPVDEERVGAALVAEVPRGARRYPLGLRKGGGRTRGNGHVAAPATG